MEPVLSEAIDLVKPVRRGEETIESVRVRKPQSGELRGLSLNGILQSDVDNHLKVLPRITVPPLTAAEVEALDPVDFMQLSSVTVGFFMTPDQKAFAQELLSKI